MQTPRHRTPQYYATCSPIMRMDVEGMEGRRYYPAMEFSNNFAMENIENLESVKSFVKSKLKICLVWKTHGFHDK